VEAEGGGSGFGAKLLGASVLRLREARKRQLGVKLVLGLVQLVGKQVVLVVGWAAG